MTAEQSFLDTNPAERFRVWRQVGDSYLADVAAHSSAGLSRAADAYRNAELLLDEIAIGTVDRLLLYAAHGRVLLQLAGGGDVDLASAAAVRLANSLSLARKYLPEHVAEIKLDLCRAEHIIAARRDATTRNRLHETHA